MTSHRERSVTNEKQRRAEFAKAALNSFEKDAVKALRLFDDSVALEDRLGRKERENLASDFVDALRRRVQERRARSRARLRHLLAGAGRALKEKVVNRPENSPETLDRNMSDLDTADRDRVREHHAA